MLALNILTKYLLRPHPHGTRYFSRFAEGEDSLAHVVDPIVDRLLLMTKQAVVVVDDVAERLEHHVLGLHF